MTQRGADGLWELEKDFSLLRGGWHSAGDLEVAAGAGLA